MLSRQFIESSILKQEMLAEFQKKLLPPRLPQLAEDTGTYELLTFIREFQLARATMSWTTGPKLYKKFLMHLQGYHCQMWSDEAVVTFDKTVLAFFKQQLLENEDYDNQMEFIRDLCKPRETKPVTLLLYLCIQNSMVQELSSTLNAGAGFSDMQLQRIYMHTMPLIPGSWQTIEPILDLMSPQTVKQLHFFIGMINLYQDMWHKHAHILTPLTALTKVSNKKLLQSALLEC
jgi:hypothetical protein